MKKAIATFYLTCLAGGIAVAQTSVRIGDMEITFRKNDTTVVYAHSRPVNPPERSATHKKSVYNASESGIFIGFGFAIPNSGSACYAVTGGSSYNFDVGFRWYTHFNRRLAVGGTLQYSFYRYRLRDALSDSLFKSAVLGSFVPSYEVRKQEFRSNNLALGVFTRFYLIPRKHYVDLGVQGDWAAGRYYKLLYPHDGKQKFHADNTFSAFTASAIAQIGWRGKAIFAYYRLTDVFDHSALARDLPPLSIGFRLELD
ncbi:MAG: hypothetical protein LBG47_05195 [Prevotellaceae bacterium]|nr:hypothetical protein [Prevotellaceae bacterium]